MVACFFGGNYVFKVLKWRLEQANFDKSGKAQIVRIMFGTNQLSVYHVRTNDAVASLVGTNKNVKLEIVPLTIGTNQVLGLSDNTGIVSRSAA